MACPKFHKLRSLWADFFTSLFGFRICKYLLFKYLNFNFFFISQLDISFSHAWILHPFFISLRAQKRFYGTFWPVAPAAGKPLKTTKRDTDMITAYALRFATVSIMTFLFSLCPVSMADQAKMQSFRQHLRDRFYSVSLLFVHLSNNLSISEKTFIFLNKHQKIFGNHIY